MGHEKLADHELPPSHPDPFVLELNRFQNQLKEKEMELLAAQNEIKALKANEALKDKALEELTKDVSKLEGKLRVYENLIDEKKLEIKRLIEEKKETLAAQYAAEATLRRVYTDQKDDDSLPLESAIAPLEAEIKLQRQEIAALQEDKKALERLTKSKELALVEAERILRSALERALIVEEVQNQNFELRRQIEICREEHKILEKTNRQKVLEIEKLCHTIQELEEAILAGGAAANTIRDYRRQISELNEEKRTLERDLARSKVSANRVALVVANEWKDDNDKVMPVKQWLEERRLLHGEMQRLKDKLAIAERTAKAEAQLKERLKQRLKTVEDGLRSPNAFYSSTKEEKSSNILGFLTSSSQPRASVVGRTYGLNQPNDVRKNGVWALRDKVADTSEKENTGVKSNKEENGNSDVEDVVSGFLYDRLQKEVINLRKACQDKDATLNTKDEEIKMLMKKVEALTKSIEVENKKAKRQAAAREKENGPEKVFESKRVPRHKFL